MRNVTIIDRLSEASRIGLGLAAVGRPGYINLGRTADLPVERTVEALRARAHDLLDGAYAAGVRYFDVARSYGRAEEFLAQWLRARPAVEDVVVGSKWGYTYTAGWRVDAEVHEVKDHSVATFERQLGESLALLGDRLSLYQIHSVTPDSPALRDPALHRRLADLAERGVVIGLSTSGPAQAEAIRAALAVRMKGRPLFRSVQATWNLLEPSAGSALAEAHDAGCLVIVKEALANGRLATGRLARGGKAGGDETRGDETGGDETGGEEAGGEEARGGEESADAVALAAVLHQPWVGIVLSGAATGAQLASNLRAETLAVDPARWEGLAMPSSQYWTERSQLPWA